ncbi:MAG TPA: PadR family transcriptional regulator [Streptosporangiaceae bacterium]
MHEEDDWPRRGGRRSSRPERGERPSREGWGPPRRGPRMEKHVRHAFGPGPFWMGDEPRRRARVKRGDVRAAVLALLAEEPRNGYQIIQEIAARSGGVWQPSPGSVYPALQQLKDEGLIHPEDEGFSLTDEGRTYMIEHADEVDAPWEVVAGREHGGMREMRPLVGQVAMAAMQVVHAGSESQIAEAQRVLKDTRRSLYRILAADDDAGADEEQAGPADAAGEVGEAGAERD